MECARAFGSCTFPKKTLQNVFKFRPNKKAFEH